MKTTRLKQMERYIVEKDFVTITELCEKFQIHPNTARSDIKELVNKGVAYKRYGGVGNSSSNPPIDFDEKQQNNRQSKRKIGQVATGFLEEDDIVFIDAGTTTLRLFQNIDQLPQNLTIITNNLNVINWVVSHSNYTVFALPGKCIKQLKAMASLETIDSLRTYNIQKAFIGTRGISAKGELSSMSNIDAKLKSTVIELSEKVYLMADSNKINHSAMFNFGQLEQIDCWICDSDSEEIQALSQKFNTKIAQI